MDRSGRSARRGGLRSYRTPSSFALLLAGWKSRAASRLAVQLAETLGQDDFDASRRGVDARADFLGKRHQQFTVRGIHDQQRRSGDLFADPLHLADAAEPPAAALPDLAAGQIGDVVAACGQRQPLGEWNLHLEPAELLGVGNFETTFEVEDRLVLVQPAGADGHGPRRGSAVREVSLAKSFQAFGEVGEDLRGHFAATPVRTQDPRQGHSRKTFGGHYSRISKVRRFFNFIPAAPRMVRMDFAVRPCRPITLPRSLGWTRSSSTVTCSPSTA